MTPQEQIISDERAFADRLRALTKAIDFLDACAGQELEIRVDSGDPLESVEIMLDLANVTGVELGGEDDAGAIAAILAMAEENARSEAHRNDLYDKVMTQITEIGALKAQNARLREALSGIIEWCRDFEESTEQEDAIQDIARAAIGKDHANAQG